MLSAESTRDLSWVTTTCEFGWTVQGIRPPEGGDATAITCCDSNHQGSVVAAAGGASGGISLFALPCVDKGGAIAKVSDRCHSDRVSHISWSYDDEVVLSIGGSDLAVCQWRHGRKPRKPDGNATTESTDNIVFESRVDAAKRIQSTSMKEQRRNIGRCLIWKFISRREYLRPSWNFWRGVSNGME